MYNTGLFYIKELTVVRTSGCLRDFIRYASLNVLGMLGLSCYILADTYFVAGGLGTNGLTALNLAIPIYGFINGSGLMIGMGGGTKYSIRKNQGNHGAADRIFSHAILLASLFGVLFAAIGLLGADVIVRLMGADQEVFAMTRTYVRTVMAFAPAFALNHTLLCFVRNDGAPQRAMAAMIGGSMSNVVLDYVFVFPCNMGIFGAAFATGLAPVISILILSPHWLKKRNGFHFTRCRYEGKTTAGIVSCGLPSLVTELSSGIVILVFNGIILGLNGNTGVAAYGVIANLSLVVVAIFTGIAQGIQPLLSSNFGADNRKNVQSILRYALIVMLALSCMVYDGVLFGAEQIAAVFNSEHSALLQDIAVRGLKLYFVACPFVGFNIILAVYFTSTEHARPAQILSLLRGFILMIPMAYLLSAWYGMTGVWCAFPVTELLVAVGSLVVYFVLRGKNRSLA